MTFWSVNLCLGFDLVWMCSPLCLWLQFASSVWSWQFGWPSHTDTGSRQRPLSHMNSSLEQLSEETRTIDTCANVNECKWQSAYMCFHMQTTDCVQVVWPCTEQWTRCLQCCHQSGRWPTLYCCLCWLLVELHCHRTCMGEIKKRTFFLNITSLELLLESELCTVNS